MHIVDAHLDLAYNAVDGRRDMTIPCPPESPDGSDVPTTSLPDLRAGGTSLVCATIYCEPSRNDGAGYRNADQAYAKARQQLAWYETQFGSRQMRMVRRADELPAGQNEPIIPMILLLEGADPIRSPLEAQHWFDLGLRIVGMAWWTASRYAGGNGEPGPLTADGFELVRQLDRLGILHDVSHLAEESFWQLLQTTDRAVLASHSNCRALVPGERQISDEMIRAIAKRDGMIGVNFYDRFLIDQNEPIRRATLSDVVRHIDHLAQVTGGVKCIGLGTDMDGGFGRAHVPVEIRTSANLMALADVLRNKGYPDPDILGIMGENWLRYFKRELPQGG